MRENKSADSTVRIWKIVALLVPTVLAAVLIGATLGGSDQQESRAASDEPVVTAAVVNSDEPVEVGGQMTPLGRQLVGELVNSDDPRVDWVMSGPEDAEAGLESGEYSVVVTIPEEFSAAATSAAAEDGGEARTAQITVERSQADRATDELLTREILQSSLRSVGDLVTGTFLDSVFIGFTEMNAQLGEAADGASQLADGNRSLRDGLRELSGGTQQLADNVPRLISGADTLSVGAGELEAGAGELRAGVGELSAGASELSAGLGEMEDQTARFPQQTRELADGAGQVADGVEQLTGVVDPAAGAALAALDGAPDLSGQVEQLRMLSERCTGPALCAELDALAETVSQHSELVAGNNAEVRAAITSMRDDVNQLGAGARQVADGAEELANAAPQLTSGVTEAADGADALAGGLAEAHSGTGELASGAGQLSDGAGQLATGVTQAGDGVTQLNAGAGQLGEGSAAAADGAGELAGGLGEAVEQLPGYDPEQTEHMADVLTTPVDPMSFDTRGVNVAVAGLLAVLMLWASSAVYFLFTRALPADLGTAAGSTGRLLRRGFVSRLLVAVLQAAVVTTMLAVVVSPGVGIVLLAFVATCLASWMFTGVNRAVSGVFPRAGVLVAVGVAVLALLAGLTSLAPDLVQSVAGLLPTAPALTAVQGALVSDSGALMRGILGTLAWGAVAAGALWIVGERKRSAGSS